jgi:predicted Fe-Mo cluster-binding NifX family protein
MIVCVPVTSEGLIDPRWGRADRVAVADVVDAEILSWLEVEVSWSRMHDEGTPGSHHARVVTFLRAHHVEAVVANHMGDGMVRMLDTMGLPVHMGAAGDARAAVQASGQVGREL